MGSSLAHQLVEEAWAELDPVLEDSQSKLMFEPSAGMFSSGITEHSPGSPRAWNARALWQAMIERRGRARVVSLACCALSLALLSPTLSTGLVADDLLHQLMLQKDPGIRGLSYRPLDLFRFADGNADTARRLIDEGVFPWWAGPETVLAFFRPLACCAARSVHYRPLLAVRP